MRVSLEPRSISPELFKQAKRILGLSGSAGLMMPRGCNTNGESNVPLSTYAKRKYAISGLWQQIERP
jgi:hypothetical protein